LALKTITATDARVHFGEVLQRVIQNNEAIQVERSGKPVAVIVPLEQYERLASRGVEHDWKARVQQVRAKIQAELGDQELIPAEEIINQAREERSEQQLGLR
jgi:prevent-host-death family protein